jgi:hypothetical protein
VHHSSGDGEFKAAFASDNETLSVSGWLLGSIGHISRKSSPPLTQKLMQPMIGWSLYVQNVVIWAEEQASRIEVDPLKFVLQCLMAADWRYILIDDKVLNLETLAELESAFITLLQFFSLAYDRVDLHDSVIEAQLVQATCSTRYSYEKCLAMTDDGCLAVVSAETKLGDQLCILKGCPMPFVLRLKAMLFRSSMLVV